MAAVNKVTTTTTGVCSDYIVLGPGDHTVDFVWVGSAGDADVVSRIPGSDTFIDVEDSLGVVNLTADRAIRVSGNREITVDVNTHTSALTIVACSCEQ